MVNFGDARLEELKLLAELDRLGGLTESFTRGPRQDMVAFLIFERLVNGLNIPWNPPSTRLTTGLPGESDLERRLQENWVSLLSEFLAGRSVHLELSHRGRVRLSELKQAMTTGKIREQFGILWDGRHVETDLQVAILDACKETSLSVGFLDMNGLKSINDTFGHDVGSLALRAYFHAVATALADKGQAYRIGGDEVIAIMPCHDADEAKATLRKACLLLMGEKLEFAGRRLPRVSLSVGVTTTTDPKIKSTALREWADVAMYRAKEKGRGPGLPPSTIAAPEGEVFMIPFDDQMT